MAETESNEPEKLDPKEAMRQAHDELITLFRAYTPDWLRAQWGES